jgi:hypothetical protein
LHRARENTVETNNKPVMITMMQMKAANTYRVDRVKAAQGAPPKNNIDS